MKHFLNFFIFLLLTSITLNAYDINDKVIKQKDFENKTIYLPLNNYRTLKFDTRIKHIQLTNNKNIVADFIDTEEAPLTMLKVLGRNIGNESAIVTLENGKNLQINFSIMQNLDSIISIVKVTFPNLIIEQANDTIILKGFVKDYKERDTVLNIFQKAGIQLDEKLVDMIETSTPSKMIKIKLYAVEINNDEGLTLKNNWSVSIRNYAASNDGDTYTYYPAGDAGSIAQYNGSITGALDSIMANAVSLSGGLSSAANFLSKNFNTALVLQYLQSEGVANVLDETTLVTLENKEATFHAGGTIMIKTQSTTAQGLPTSRIEPIDYGLQLGFKAKNIMQDEYVDLEIDTKSTDIDWTNTNPAEGLYSFAEKKLKTHVLARDGNTIVLGGLIGNQNSNTVDKIPLLGDIPILGKLFTSTAFNEGKSELVFFITPEIVDPAKNDQTKLLKTTKSTILNTSKYRGSLLPTQEETEKDDLSLEKEKTEVKEADKEIKEVTTKTEEKKEKELTAQEKHKKWVNEYLGYE